MKKGVILEIDEGFLTLMTPEGEFLRARRQDYRYSIGQEIDFFPIENQLLSRSQKRSFLLKRKPIWAFGIMAATLLLFLGSLMPMNQDNKAYAYMSIDEKPSIELGVNKNMEVVELTGYNKEGKKIISAIPYWKKKQVSKVTETILAEMKHEGYLKKNGDVVLSTVRTKDTDKYADSMLNQNIKEIKAKASEEQLKVKVFNGTVQEREKAQKLGITTGKYYETQIEPSKVVPGTIAPIEQTDQENANPPQPVHIPPGQQKKQTGMSQSQPVNRPMNKPNNNVSTQAQVVTHQRVTGTIPPGQLKKIDEEQTKQKFGQVKKKLIENNGLDNIEKHHK